MNIEELVKELIEAVEEPVKAVKELIEAVEEPVKAVEEPVKAVEEPVKAVEEPVKAVEEPVKAVEEPVKVVEEPVKVVEEPVKVVEEPVKVVEEPVKVVEEPVKVVEEPVKVVEEPVKNTIPKIIHQLWIGPYPMPSNLMKTWKNKNPDYEYILWNESEIKKRGFQFKCYKKIFNMKEICGKADIMRWEILCKYGGIFIDADSICIEPLDDSIINNTAFASYENEKNRGTLVANGTMGFIPNHPLCIDAIKNILTNNINNKAWITVGPGLLTKLIESGKYSDIKIYPSYYFIPIHYEGLTYLGHRKVYAHQEWGSTRKIYNKMNSLILPNILKEPELYVSIIIDNYNIEINSIKSCLNSIIDQSGHFGIELVFINNGSDENNTLLIEKFLNEIQNKVRFFKIIYIRFYIKLDTSIEICKKFCTNKLIFEIQPTEILNENKIFLNINNSNNSNNSPKISNFKSFVNNKNILRSLFRFRK
jgi:predicted nuclease with TOPRIM domain